MSAVSFQPSAPALSIFDALFPGLSLGLDVAKVGVEKAVDVVRPIGELVPIVTAPLKAAAPEIVLGKKVGDTFGFGSGVGLALGAAVVWFLFLRGR